VPPRYAIARANRMMADQVDYLICYVRYAASNARNLLDYAQRKTSGARPVITNIAENGRIL